MYLFGESPRLFLKQPTVGSLYFQEEVDSLCIHEVSNVADEINTSD